MSRLAIDIGNTKTALGIFREDSLVDQWRIGTHHWTADELWVLIHSLLSLREFDPPDSVAYACVVPQIRHSINNVCSKYLDLEPVEVSIPSAGIETDYRYPHEIGADRIANVVGAMVLGPTPSIVADFGTATTFDVINEAGRYVGGAILPGIGTAAGELFRKAEKLNPVDLVFPESPLGTTTTEAIRSGVLLGAVGAADHMIELLSGSLDGDPVFWATGGWASGIARKCATDFKIVPELTLIGINETGRRNKCQESFLE